MKSSHSKLPHLLIQELKLYLDWGLFFDATKKWGASWYFLFSFKLESSAADALRDYSSNKVDYVKFEIDTTQEIIRSLNSDKFKGNTEKLQEKVSTSTPNYHLFKFKYDHQSKEQNKNIFIYSIPSEVQIPIKVK